MGFGLSFRNRLGMVLGRGRLLVAAKYLLDLYFPFRFLLVTWEKKIKTGSDNLYRWNTDYGCYCFCNARKPGSFWCPYIAWVMFSFDASFGEAVKKMPAADRIDRQHFFVCAV